ncbi:MAG TPA: HypC/HybG/HupF family hydrogenase formation chaperone, partial [Burkholderiaceae bacterium]|nr:HypC/HybG/HupF family hydrogenase formation chaperone [Burkholderiaceae bacterium]
MCVGIPMRVLSNDDGMAECEGRGRRERINAMLLGDLPTGTWVLAYQGSAVRAMSADEAQQTNQALDALAAAMDGSDDIDLYFADLVG